MMERENENNSYSNWLQMVAGPLDPTFVVMAVNPKLFGVLLIILDTHINAVQHTTIQIPQRTLYI